METFSNNLFNKYSQFIYNKLGIHVSYEKKALLKNKLERIMKRHNVKTFEEFYDIVSADDYNPVWLDFTHSITTHETNFFREKAHFDFNIDFITSSNIRILQKSQLRLWSAGCSSGEEPYSLAILFCEYFPEIDIKILATDISKDSLIQAQKGIYENNFKNNISNYILGKYFTKKDSLFEVKEFVKNKITFRQFNLMNEFNSKNKLDIIFCRNVMIYFNVETQQKVLNKFHENLMDGGLLFIGHSESLINKKHNFKYVQPTIYQK